MVRPENQMPAEIYYSAEVSEQYASSTRIQTVQRQLAERAVELLNIVPEPGCLVLDIGAGSGLSGEVLKQEGFEWVGLDISLPMLELAAQDCEGDLLLSDVGQGFRFRPGSFDAAISISTIQWLCVASKRSHNPFRRLLAFFQSLYTSLRFQGRAALQFYPDGSDQLEMITTAAMKAGFSGGLVVDNPNSTKTKKYFLVLEAGGNRNLSIVPISGVEEAGEGSDNEVRVYKKKRRVRKGRALTGRAWVKKQRERHKRQGRNFRHDSKYVGRKRRNFSV